MPQSAQAVADVGFLPDVPTQAAASSTPRDVGFVPDNDLGFVPDQPPISAATTDLLQRQMRAQMVGQENDTEGNTGLTRQIAEGVASLHPESLLNGNDWIEAAKNFLPSRIANRIIGAAPDAPFVPKSISDPLSYAFSSSVGDAAATLGANKGARKVEEGLGQSVADTALGFVSPDMVVGGGMIKAGGTAAQLAKAAFASQMISAAPDAYAQAKHAIRYGDEAEIARASLNLATITGLPLLIVKSELASPETPIQPPTTGREIPMPKGAVPRAPSTVPVAPPLAPLSELAHGAGDLDKLQADLAAKEAAAKPAAPAPQSKEELAHELDNLNVGDPRFDDVVKQLSALQEEKPVAPAIQQDDGTVLAGKTGDEHRDIIAREVANGVLANGEHGFVNASGEFMTRDEAGKALGLAQPLDSQTLNEIQKNEQLRQTQEQAGAQAGSHGPVGAGGEHRAEEIGQPGIQPEGGVGEGEGVPALGKDGQQGTVTRVPNVERDSDGYADTNQPKVQSFLDTLPIGTRVVSQFGGDVYVKGFDGEWWHDEKDLTPGNSRKDQGQASAGVLANGRILPQKGIPNETQPTPQPNPYSAPIPAVAPPPAEASHQPLPAENLHRPDAQQAGAGGDFGFQPDATGAKPFSEKEAQSIPANAVAAPTDLFAPKPKIVPLGGDVAGAEGEAAAGRQGSPTAMKYRLIDEERQKRGEPPLTKSESVSDQALMDQATAAIDRNPELPEKLVAELNSKPRAIDASERMVLLLRKIDLRNEYYKAVSETLQAFDDSKEFPDRRADMVSAQLRRAEIGQRLDDLERASRVSGSEVGRSLRALRIMANEDYSLASMERDARAARGGEDLSPVDLAEIKRMADEHARVTAELKGKLDASERSKAESDSRLAEIQRQVAAEPKIGPHVKIIADKIRGYFDERAAKALKDLQGTAWSVGPEILLKLTDLGVSKILSGAAEFTGWSAQMVEALGEKVRPHLQAVWDAANKALSEQVERIGRGSGATKERVIRVVRAKQSLDDEIVSRGATVGKLITEGEKDSLTWQIQQLARLFVRKGITDRNALVDAIHEVIQKYDPTMTRRDTMDAISGYGDFKQLSKDDVSVRLRDLKGQMQKVAQLEDLQGRQPPLKSGVERRTPSDEERRLIAQVEEAKRRFGVTVTDPETQLRSALDARKTYYRNQISDFEAQIASRERFVKTKSPTPTDVELDGLKAKRDIAKEQFQKILEQDPDWQTEQSAARLARQKASLQKDIADMEQRLRDGDIQSKGNQVNRPAPPDIEELKQRRDALNQQIAEARKKPDSENYAAYLAKKLADMNGRIKEMERRVATGDVSAQTKARVNRPMPPELEQARQQMDALNQQIADLRHPEKTPLEMLKNRIQSRIDNLHERLAKGDFSEKPRTPVVMDRVVQELQARKNAIEQKFKSAKARWEAANLPKVERTFDLVSNARRFAVLSGVRVLAKLAAYSASKIPTMAAADVIGGAISHIPKISEIAAKASSEGGMQMGILARAVAKGLTKGFQDAYQTATKGKSELKLAYGHSLDLGFHWYQIPQLMHEIIKSPLRRVAFERSLARRMVAAARGGADITDPLTQLALAKDAYLDSDRALLLEQNQLATGIRNIIRMGDKPEKSTGEANFFKKAASTFARVEMPIMTVPFNYVKQTMVAAFGIVSGGVKARAAFRRGIDTLAPEEGNAIMRHLNYGTIGGAMLLYGFFDGYYHSDDESKSTFGGFYQPGEKRKADQAGVNGMKVLGVKLPGFLLHNPVLAAGQLGHTIGAIAASKFGKKNPDTRGVTVGTIAGMLGLLNESPMGRPVELVNQLTDPRDSSYALGEHVKGLVIPQIVQETAEITDRDAHGNVIKRKPENVPQHIETGIPGLRQQVPQANSLTVSAQALRASVTGTKNLSNEQAKRNDGKILQTTLDTFTAKDNLLKSVAATNVLAAETILFRSKPLADMRKIYEGANPDEKKAWLPIMTEKEKRYGVTNNVLIQR